MTKFILSEDLSGETILELTLPSNAKIIQLRKYIAVAAHRDPSKVQLKLPTASSNSELKDTDLLNKYFDEEQIIHVNICYIHQTDPITIDLVSIFTKQILQKQNQLIFLSPEKGNDLTAPMRPTFFLNQFAILKEYSDEYFNGVEYIGIMFYGRYATDSYIQYHQKIQPGNIIIKRSNSREMNDTHRHYHCKTMHEALYLTVYKTNRFPDDLIAEYFLLTEQGKIEWTTIPAKEAYVHISQEIETAVQVCIRKFLQFSWEKKLVCQSITLSDLLDNMDPLELCRCLEWNGSYSFDPFAWQSQVEIFSEMLVALVKS